MGYSTKKTNNKQSYEYQMKDVEAVSVLVYPNWNPKRVGKYDLQGTYLQSYSSVKKAAESVGVTLATLSGALNGRSRRAGGFIWKFETGWA